MFKIPTDPIKIPTDPIKIPTDPIKIPTDPIKIPIKLVLWSLVFWPLVFWYRPKMTSTKKYKVNPSMLFCSQIIFCVRRKYRKKYSAILYWSHNSKSWKIKALFTQKTDEVFKIYAPQINAFIWGESVKICHYHLQMKQTSKSHAKRPLRLLADQNTVFLAAPGPSHWLSFTYRWR